MEKNITYSVIIPAYNEAVCLPVTLAVLEKAMATLSLPGEVIVVDNNSTDATPEIAREFGARVVFEPYNQISRARNTGGRVATGDYLIFLDADTFLSGRLLKTAFSNLSAGSCGGGAVVDFYRPVQPAIRKAVDLWNLCSLRFKVAAGCFIYCHRQGFEATGGFSEKVYAGEDLWFSRSLRSWGKRKGLTFQVIKYPPIITSSRKLEWFTPVELFLILLIGAFPLSVRNRSLCAFWYRRPKTDASTKK
jgi:glycosyltransferase involved in cell wall biosynthesis